uniref:Uncharacterized protein n=1 Tax=Rhizoctonia cerealis hypovirus TaxID=3068667 RepID=A0AA51BS95_9VIRU|nr:MAG: hypothetical protein [Rhizoctonia cerealis hypovirus]
MDFINKLWLMLFPGPSYVNVSRNDMVVNYRKHIVTCTWNFNLWGLGTHKQKCKSCFKEFEFDHYIDWTSVIDLDPCLAPASTKRNTMPTLSQNFVEEFIVPCSCVTDASHIFELKQVDREQYLAMLIPPFTSDDIESLHIVLQHMPNVQILSNTIGICKACTKDYVCVVLAQQPGWVYVMAGDIGDHFGPKIQVMSTKHCPHPQPGVIPTVGYVNRVRRDLPHYGFLICPDDIDFDQSYQVDVGYLLDTNDGLTLKKAIDSNQDLLPIINKMPTIECDLYNHHCASNVPQQFEVTRSLKVNKHDVGRLCYAKELLSYFLPGLNIYPEPIGGYYFDLPAPKVWNHRPHSYYIGDWNDFYVGIEAYDYNMTVTLVHKMLGETVAFSPPFYTFMQNSSANCRPRQLVFEAGDVADLPATWIPPSVKTSKLPFAHLKNWWSEGVTSNIQRYASPFYYAQADNWPNDLCACLIKSHRKCNPYVFKTGFWRDFVSDKLGLALISKHVRKVSSRKMLALGNTIMELEGLKNHFGNVLICTLDENQALVNIYRGVIDISGCIPKYWRVINSGIRLNGIKVFNIDAKVTPLVVFNVKILK